MTADEAVPAFDLGQGVTTDTIVGPDRVVRVDRPSGAVVITVERAVRGKFRDAFPVGARDLRVEIVPCEDLQLVTELLQRVADQFAVADPACRRLILAAPEGDVLFVAAAELAGFRFVVDVEVADGCYSLLVVEPIWVTAIDMDLDRVPQT